MKRMQRSVWIGMSILVVMTATMTAVLSEAGSPEEDRIALLTLLGPIPPPDMSNLDSQVDSQLRLARSEMEAVLADPKASVQELAGAYGTLGQVYHAYEYYSEARACYENASRLQPDSFTWWHMLGDVSRHESRLEDAVTEFEGALSLNQSDFAALVYLGDIFLELNREAEAEMVYRRAMTLYPGSPSVMAGLGQLALRRQEYEDAVSFFKAVLVSVPDANRLHYSLAMAYRGLGKMDQARRQLQLRGTVGIKPPDPLLSGLSLLKEGERVHLVRGRLAFAAGRFNEAAAEFEQAVAADPTSVRALVNLGTTLSQLGEEAEAIVRFQEALALDDTNITAHFNLASLFFAQVDFEKTLAHIRRVVAETPNDAEARFLIARTFVKLGDDQASLVHFEQTAKLQPGNESAVIEGAAALVRLQLYPRAKRVLEAGVERLPESGWIAFALARLLAACPDETVRDGKRALELALEVYEADQTPRHAQTVAQALAEVGMCDEAAEWQQSLVEGAQRDGADGAADGLRTDLDLYRAGPPCRPPIAQIEENG